MRITDPSFQAAVTSDALDGCGPLMLKIAIQVAKYRNSSVEDVFSEAVVHYLKHKHKYDSSRGARTTYVQWLLKSRLWTKQATKRQEPTRTAMDNVAPCVYDTPAQEYSPDAARVLEILRSTTATKPGIKTIKRQTQWPKAKIMDVLAEIQDGLPSRRSRPCVYFTKQFV